MSIDPALTIQPLLAKHEARRRNLWRAFLAIFNAVSPEDLFRRTVAGRHGWLPRCVGLDQTLPGATTPFNVNDRVV